jgi:hypothetical protein
MVLPDQDKYSTTRSEMLNQLAYMLGGRAAEELVFHDPTTGASNDIEKATAVARAMVTQYGMTERLGAIRYGKENGEVFLGRDMGHMRDYSEEVAAAIDEEVRSLIDHAHNEAFEILVDNREVLDALVIELLERETLNKEEVAAIFEPLRLRPKRPAWTGSERRTPSDRPPVDVPPRPEEPVAAAVVHGAYGLPAPSGGYGVPGYGAPPPGQPVPAAPGHPGVGHPASGYPGSGHAGTAHPGSGHTGTVHPGAGHPGAGPAGQPGSFGAPPAHGGGQGSNGGHPSPAAPAPGAGPQAPTTGWRPVAPASAGPDVPDGDVGPHLPTGSADQPHAGPGPEQPGPPDTPDGGSR